MQSNRQLRISNGFPDFLANATASTRAWNLGGTTQTLNSVTVAGVSFAVGIVNDIAFTGATALDVSFTPGSSSPGWVGDPQVASN